MGKVVIGSQIGHSAHEIVEFKIFGVRRKKVNRADIVEFKTANLKLSGS